MDIKTVRVRIAVAVNARGDFGVSLASGLPVEEAAECALEMLYPKSTAEAVHFVEADIPLPVSELITGTLVECA